MATNLRFGVTTKGQAARSPILQGKRSGNSIAPRDTSFGSRNSGRNVRHDAQFINGSRTRDPDLSKPMGPAWP